MGQVIILICPCFLLLQPPSVRSAGTSYPGSFKEIVERQVCLHLNHLHHCHMTDPVVISHDQVSQGIVSLAKMFIQSV